MYFDRVRALLRPLVPAELRTTISRDFAKRAYHKFLAQKFGDRFHHSLPAAIPDSKFIMKTNSRTQESFEATHKKRTIGSNVYLTTGYNAAHLFLKRLQEHGCNIADIRSVFEFGCGDGRVIRHFRSIKGIQLIGSDTREEAVEFCRENLTGADFFVNSFEPSLPFIETGTIDFAYALSVFTHIPADAQIPWLRELFRILRPGAFLMVTVMGQSLKSALSSERQNELASSGVLEISADDNEAHLATKVGGSNWDIYQSRERIVTNFGSVFQIMDYLPDGLSSSLPRWRDLPPLGQDLVVLRKPRQHSRA